MEGKTEVKSLRYPLWKKLMNSIMTEYYPVFEMYQALRNQLMEIITDEDLKFRPDENNPTLGYLCKEIGEVEYAYIQSFKTFRQDFSYRNVEVDLDQSVERLSTWFTQLDGELKHTVENLPEEDIQNRKIDRGGDFILAPQIQLEVYKEALLIFYGKVSVYLKALEKPFPQQWQAWIT
jgi:hypothetical protein